MEEHFRAFSFVDQVTLVEPGARVRGRYAIPSGINAFPPSLAAEAVGQLAAWGAMAAIDFTHRPLAGIAGEVELLAPLRPGHRLDLAANLESVDSDSVVYSGEGHVDGTPVIRLTDCVGPMVPLDEYDDPAAVRSRFSLICDSGACTGAFEGIPPLALERTAGDVGRSIQAELVVPESASFFADHFPRRAVFPGTLLVHTNLDLAHRLVAELPGTQHGTAWTIRKIAGVKLRAFIPPGAGLHLEARVMEERAQELVCGVETRSGRRTVCSAQVLFTCKDKP
jgi:3-hydroxymyristoyl/3-hydroxydecanoyl-(acyl carrier protein) dehydratase